MIQQEIDRIIQGWAEEPRESARRLIDYYGPPDETSPSRLIWYRTFDGWKRTELVNTEIPHAFPALHNDYLEQSIDYRVPLDKIGALAAYDGSVVVERTRGEMSARCGGTSMNFVAINLANDIINGTKSVDEARDEYSRLYEAFQQGEKPPYTQAFQFPLPKDDTRDQDVSTLNN
jgi:hypothetical protein